MTSVAWWQCATNADCRPVDLRTADWPFPINFENNIVQPLPFPHHAFTADRLAQLVEYRTTMQGPKLRFPGRQCD